MKEKTNSKKAIILSATAISLAVLTALLFGHPMATDETIDNNLKVGGTSNAIDGGRTAVVGYSHDVKYSNSDCFTAGLNSTLTGFRSFAFGMNNIVQKSDAMAIGRELNVKSTACTVVGRYNESSVATDEYAFVVGVGDSSERKNGLVVTNNGDVIVPQVQGDIPMYSGD